MSGSNGAGLPNPSEDEIVRELQQTVSASRLSLFLQCRLKFYFRYVKGISKPTSPALHLGSCVHSTLSAWNKARWRREPLTTEQLRETYAKAWNNEEHATVNWQGREEEQEKTGWALVETYLRESNASPDVMPDAVEVPIEADLRPHGLPVLVGVLDLVRQGVIVEYKTSSSTPSPDHSAHVHEVQVTGYAVLFRACTGQTEQGIEIHTLVKLKTPRLIVAAMPIVTEQRKLRLFRLIESYVAGLDRCEWIPAPGLQCSACEYFSECRRW